MKASEIKNVLHKHSLWLRDKAEGEMAYLGNAYLRGADLGGADLRGADLRGACLRGANLRGADLWGANLRGADLWDANLWDANLQDANLQDANLQGVNLKDANLQDANLQGASLRGADLRGAILPHFKIVPTEGSFIGYKKTTKGVIKLLIPEDAKRTNSLVGRKCRASKAIVLGGDGIGGTGKTYNGVVYNEGEEVHPDSYDDDIRIECTNGIHFFMTEEEAKEW